MGFLKRLLGGGESASPVAPVTQGTWNVNYFTQIRDDAALQIVGEVYRQENVLSARPPGATDLPPGLPPPPAGHFKAMLFAEPTNQFDRNAIAVALWAGGNWALSGYLSREDAVLYKPLLVHLATTSSGTPPAIACDAALIAERDGTGVVLHLGTPAECAAELTVEERAPAAHRWAGQTVAFTGQGRTAVHGVPIDRFAQVMLARWAGCVVVPRLTKATNALIVADRAEVTGNLQRATTYGTEIVDEPDFLVEVGLPPEAVSRVTNRWATG